MWACKCRETRYDYRYIDRLTPYTREEAERLNDQLSPVSVHRAWEYYALLAEQRSLGG